MYMRSFVLNLKRQKEKLATFLANNDEYLSDLEVVEATDGRKIDLTLLRQMGFDTNKHWRDPLLNRTITHGEVGCFISHFRMWQRCIDENEHFLIFEDDVVVERELTDELADEAGDGILYLLWNEMRTVGARESKPCYPYWLCAYVISPVAAKILIDSFLNIIPADEYVPYLSDRVTLRSLEDSGCRLQSRGSSTEPTGHKDYFIDFKTHVVTVASDETKAKKLFDSAEQNDIKVTNLWPTEKEWQGGLNNYSTGGGVKLNLLREFIKDKSPEDVIVFTDAYDVFFCSDLEEIIRRYLSFKTEVVIQAEKNNWPALDSQWPPAHTPYRYLCSGVIIGRVRELRKLITKDLLEAQSDQLYLQTKYLEGHHYIKLDHEMYISASSDSSAIKVSDGKILNTKTHCLACIYHGNGGPKEKQEFDRLYREIYPKRNYLQTKRV